MPNAAPPNSGERRKAPRPKNGPVTPPPVDDLDPRQLLKALTSLKRGDFTVRLPDDWVGISGKVADTFNEVVEQNQRLAKELDRLNRAVGKEGKIHQRGTLGDV